MNSCGSTCRIFWSAGIATALAASMTCSTSPWLTSFATGPARGGAAPADGKPVRVTHVHVGNVVAALRDELQRGAHEFLEALVHLAPPEPHGDAVGQIEFPGAARIEAQRREPQPRLRQSPLGGEITLRHHRLLAFGTLEPCELGRNVVRVRVEELTARVEEAVLAPARCGALLDDQHGKSPRPGPLDTHRLHPRELMD